MNCKVFHWQNTDNTHDSQGQTDKNIYPDFVLSLCHRNALFLYNRTTVNMLCPVMDGAYLFYTCKPLSYPYGNAAFR